jgi:hypothetical protein
MTRTEGEAAGTASEANAEGEIMERSARRVGRIFISENLEYGMDAAIPVVMAGIVRTGVTGGQLEVDERRQIR